MRVCCIAPSAPTKTNSSRPATGLSASDGERVVGPATGVQSAQVPLASALAGAAVGPRSCATTCSAIPAAASLGTRIHPLRGYPGGRASLQLPFVLLSAIRYIFFPFEG